MLGPLITTWSCTLPDSCTVTVSEINCECSYSCPFRVLGLSPRKPARNPIWHLSCNLPLTCGHCHLSSPMAVAGCILSVIRHATVIRPELQSFSACIDRQQGALHTKSRTVNNPKAFNHTPYARLEFDFGVSCSTRESRLCCCRLLQVAAAALCRTGPCRKSTGEAAAYHSRSSQNIIMTVTPQHNMCSASQQ